MVEKLDAYIVQHQRAPGPILAHEFKLGGNPVLYNEEPWPLCNNCGQEMGFLAQVPLQSPILFSNFCSMAYIFMCPGKFDDRGWLTCATYDPHSGANKVIVQEYSDKALICEHPSDFPDYSLTLSYAPEPHIDTSDYSLSDALLHAVYGSTKLGGVPAWLQSNETPVCPSCGEPAIFIAQFDSELDGSLPADPAEWDSDTYKFFQFGSAGIGYLFICQNKCNPGTGFFLWQCT
jgi:uncharacterized protein YwqG